jgi:hypothetical protein
MGVGSQRHDLAALPLGKRPSTNFTESWVRFEVGLKRYEKFRRQGVRNPKRPACSKSLYRLSYRGRQ